MARDKILVLVAFCGVLLLHPRPPAAAALLLLLVRFPPGLFLRAIAPLLPLLLLPPVCLLPLLARPVARLLVLLSRTAVASFPLGGVGEVEAAGTAHRERWSAAVVLARWRGVVAGERRQYHEYASAGTPEHREGCRVMIACGWGRFGRDIANDEEITAV